MNVAEQLNNIPKIGNKKGGGVAAMAGILLLLLVVVGLYILMRGKTKSSIMALANYNKSQETRLTTQQTSARAAMSSAGITEDDANDLLSSTTGEVLEDIQGCSFYPIQGRTCKADFAYNSDTTCCEPQWKDGPSDLQLKMDLAKTIATEILITETLEFVVEKVAAKVGGKVGGKVAAKAGGKVAAKTGGKVASKLVGKAGLAAAKVATKVGQKVIGKAGVAAIKAMVKALSKIAIKVAAKLTAKLALAASAGPLGAIWMAFDILSMSLDFLDPKGYDLFTANKIIQQQFKISAKSAFDAMALDRGSYPEMFPLSLFFPSEYDDVVSPAMGLKYNQPTIDAMDAKFGADQLVAWTADYENGILDTDTGTSRLENEYARLMVVVTNADPKSRDKYQFDTLSEVLSAESKKKIFLCPWMSTTDRVGISLTKDACDEWNTAHLREWQYYTENLSKGENPTKRPDTKRGEGGVWKAPKDTDELVDNLDANGEQIPSPPVANFADQYYLLDPDAKIGDFTEGDPPMIMEKIKGGAVSLMYSQGQMGFVLCQGKQVRDGEKGKQDITIDPKKYGVKFENGQCMYTNKYCNRMGQDFKNNDCHINGAQKVAEMIFGKTITVEFKQWGEDIKECGTKPSLSACGNAIAGPVLKNTVALLSNTAKNVAGCAQGKLSGCEKMITDGPLTVPGKLVAGLAYGMAGLSALGGDYTAALTASLEGIGKVADIFADPIGALKDPLGTLGGILNTPLAILDGAAKLVGKIPIIGPVVAKAVTAVTGAIRDAANLVSDGIKRGAKALANQAKKIAKVYVDVAKKIGKGLANANRAAAEWSAKAINSAVNWTKGAIGDVGSWTSGAFNDAGDWMSGAGGTIAGGVKDVGNAVGDQVKSGVKKATKALNPSRW